MRWSNSGSSSPLEMERRTLGEWVQYPIADFYADDALIQCRQAATLQRMIGSMVSCYPQH